MSTGTTHLHVGIFCWVFVQNCCCQVHKEKQIDHSATGFTHTNMHNRLSSLPAALRGESCAFSMRLIPIYVALTQALTF